MEEFNSMPITRIYNTELNQGVNELNNIRQAITGKWGNDSKGNTYSGNLVHGLTTSGNIVTNTGSSSRCIVVICYTDDTYSIVSLDKDESRTFAKEIKIAVSIGVQ